MVLGNKNAIIYDSPISKKKRFITYNQLLSDVMKLASILQSLEVTKERESYIVYANDT